MKTKLYFLLFTLILFASCSSLQQTAVNDDIYYSPKDEPVGSNVDFYNQLAKAYTATNNLTKAKTFSDKAKKITII